MPSHTLLLIGRDARNAREVLETHADRLRDRGVADAVAVATYEDEPTRELRSQFAALDAEHVLAVPMAGAHTHDTADGVPSALAAVDGRVQYADPIGHSPAVTDVLADRAAAEVPAAADATVVLVGFGSSAVEADSQPAEFHAGRLRERTAYGEVVTCYCLRNPAVECARYTVSNERAVAVPLFQARSAATEQRIPTDLELDRGGIAYADPLGTHPRITDAVAAACETHSAGEVESIGGSRRADDTPAIAVESIADAQQLATDGEGRGPR